ncbi:Competence protein F homolog, phosphoribosyltransferase domain; protein YhgH required for utilization of DNA as sole source of carbon and energy [hydrothermal vent metagenome]|uniref:Competence protein F homolog, phosphoribosyltransferase domain protein YhgH required for utilization of DNA as sole source of carbon and energy n=1 Tax=hydrothermal vent metagenome TaxID=652676 RepID=A0A3B0W1Z7_9ZZZZ
MKRCAVCQIHCQQILCPGCQSLIQAPINPCQTCAKPLNQSNGICGECRSDPPDFSQTISAAIYEPPVSLWVQQLKFGDRIDRASIMAEALLEPLSLIESSVPIIPVPLHPKRLKIRGYNQAYEVAKIITKKQQRPLLVDTLIRTKNTAMQAELHEKQRANNVRAAFTVKGEINAETVIVLDDVMTTGQTLRSVSSCLVKAGVEKVIVAVFARSGG